MVNIRAVRLQAPATNTTQDYTASGFGTAQAVIFVAGIAGDGTDVDDLRGSYGFWDTSNSLTWAFHVAHGEPVATAGARSDQNSTNVVLMQNSSVGTIRTATASVVTDGVRLTWAGSDTTSRPYVIAILINGINGAQVGVDTPNALDSGTSVVTTTGLTPKVIFAGQNRVNVADGGVAWGTSSFGFAYDNGVSIDQRFVACNYLNGNVGVLEPSTNYISGNWGISSLDTVQEITDMTSGSFTQTTRNDNGSGAENSDLYYLALDFDEDAAIFSTTTPTATGDWSPWTGGSFTPGAFIMLPTFADLTDLTFANNKAGFSGLFVGTESESYQLSWSFDDGAATNSDTSGRTDTLLYNQNDTAGVPDFTADNYSFGSGSIDYLDADVSEGSQASYIFGIAFEASAAASGSPWNYYAQLQ